MSAMSMTSAFIARPVARAPVTARRSARAAASPVRSRAAGGAKIRGTSAFAARRIGVVVRAGEEQKAGATTADDDEMPPWERRELMKKAAMEKGGLPWPAYLGLSAIVSIAAIASRSASAITWRTRSQLTRDVVSSPSPSAIGAAAVLVDPAGTPAASSARSRTDLAWRSAASAGCSATRVARPVPAERRTECDAASRARRA